MPPTYIVLATHNGERFLADQLTSVQAQDEDAWTLLIHDDGSTDRTMEIVNRFAARDPRIQLVTVGNDRAGSAARSFGLLFQEAFERGAKYVFSCDQDDIWLPNKLGTLLTEIKHAETTEGAPVLVHHDLTVVNHELERLSESYWKMMHINPGTEDAPARLMSRNEVTGCAMGCNRALLELALPMPKTAIMHDWWLALCAAYFGKLRFTRKCLVHYRQHTENVIGARPFWSGLRPGSLHKAWARGNRELRETVDQAKSFEELFKNRFTAQGLKGVDSYATLLEHGRLTRLGKLIRSGAWRKHWFLNATLVVRVLLMGKRHR
jgi:glycosyltransferase involved in cell wall biosynthesis